MRKYVMMMMAVAAICVVAAMAGDKGPQVVPGTGNLKTGLVISPAGVGERFTPTFIVHSGEQDTQSVYYVSGSVTNLMLVYTNTAALKLKSVVDIFPPLFLGDKILITRPSSYALTNETVKILGTLYD